MLYNVLYTHSPLVMAHTPESIARALDDAVDTLARHEERIDELGPTSPHPEVSQWDRILNDPDGDEHTNVIDALLRLRQAADAVKLVKESTRDYLRGIFFEEDWKKGFEPVAEALERFDAERGGQKE